MKITCLTEVRKRPRWTGNTAYVVTAIIDNDQIVTCFLTQKHDVLQKGQTYIVKDACTWINAEQLCLQHDKDTKVVILIFIRNIYIVQYRVQIISEFLIHYYHAMLYFLGIFGLTLYRFLPRELR